MRPALKAVRRRLHMNVESMTFNEVTETAPKNDSNIVVKQCAGAAIISAPSYKKIDLLQFAGLSERETSDHSVLGFLTKKSEIDPISNQVAEMFAECEFCQDEFQLLKGFRYNKREDLQRVSQGFRNLENPYEFN